MRHNLAIINKLVTNSQTVRWGLRLRQSQTYPVFKNSFPLFHKSLDFLLYLI